MRWEDKFNRAHPSHKATKVQPVTTAVVGKPTGRLLKLKAAEMKVCFRFLHSKIEEEWASVHNGQLWLQASRAMHDLLLEIEGQPWKLSDEQVQEKTKTVCIPPLSLYIYIYIHIYRGCYKLIPSSPRTHLHASRHKTNNQQKKKVSVFAAGF